MTSREEALNALAALIDEVRQSLEGDLSPQATPVERELAIAERMVRFAPAYGLSIRLDDGTEFLAIRLADGAEFPR